MQLFNLLAVVLLVSCGQTLVLHSQPLFPVGGAVRRKKGAGYARPDLSSMQNVIVFSIAKLKAITPCGTEERAEECSGQDRLYSQFFMVSFFSESITLVISPWLQQWQDDDNEKDNSPAAVGWRTLHFTAKYLFNNICDWI